MNSKIKAEKIFPPKILEAMPKWGDTAETPTEKIKVCLKVFNCSGAQTWYLYEYDPEERIFMGFVNLGDSRFAECGTVSMDELLEVNAKMPFNMFNLDRDKHWNADTTLKEVIDRVKS